MANIVDYNLETPNTTGTEVQANKLKVQPETKNYATSGIKNQNVVNNATTNNQNNSSNPMNTLEPVVSQTAIQVPSDFYDNTIQGYLNEYNQGVNINDYQAQINALNAIDKYRVANGYEAIYTNDIYTLTNQRTAKIKNQIREYEEAIYQAQLVGDTATAQAINQQLNEYKKMVNYSESVNNSATYLGTVEYKSSYDNIINGIVSQLLTDRFIYDPSDDEALIKAQEHATNQIYESMNAKGILDSTMTAQIISEAVSNLTATYEQMSREEFYNNIERLQTSANLIMNLEEKQYDRWLANVQMKLEYYQAQKDEENYQWDRVNKLGYVDNEASIILGVPVGTISPAKREAIEESQRKTEEMYNQLYTDIALAEAKSKLENSSGTVSADNVSNGTTVYSGSMSDSDKKKVIQQKYTSGEIDDVGMIAEIFANFDESKRAAVLSDLLGMTEKEAIEYYNENIVNTAFEALQEAYGVLTEQNRLEVEKEVIEAVDNKAITEEVAEELLLKIDKDIKFNTRLVSPTVSEALKDTINGN